MVNIKTKYLGLELKNPLIASSSGLTSNVDTIKKLEAAGIGAVVLKSIFEEQIENEAAYLNRESETQNEAYDYINNYVRSNNIENYIKLISDAKKSCHIPIIASINCYEGGEWVKFAKRFEEAGADAIELNVFFIPTSKDESPEKLEKKYLDTVSAVVEAVNIPVSVKMPNHFTNPAYIIDRMYFRGIKGAVLFNRLYEPDINIENLSFASEYIFSTSAELSGTMRWLAICSSEVDKIDYAASTGIHTGADLIKVLLAGANCAQICSVLYLNGNGVIDEMLSYLQSWMEKNGFESLDQIIGIMNAGHEIGSIIYERSQFMKYYSSH